MKMIFSLLIGMMLIGGCIQNNPAEQIVQQNSEKITQDLSAYGLVMNSNYMQMESEQFWDVIVYDQYSGQNGPTPNTYCVVKAHVNKTSKQIEYMFFGLLCPVNESSGCKNFKCYSIDEINMTK
jgi:hypothetical protein